MKTAYDKIATGALVVALFFALLATFDSSSAAASDPWVLPVILAVIFSLNWNHQ